MPTNKTQLQQHRLIKKPSRSLIDCTTKPINRNRNAFLLDPKRRYKTGDSDVIEPLTDRPFLLHRSRRFNKAPKGGEVCRSHATDPTNDVIKSSNEIPTSKTQLQQYRAIKQPSQLLIDCATEPVNRNRNAFLLTSSAATKV